MRAKAQRVQQQRWWGLEVTGAIKLAAAKSADHLTKCSCYLCGNKRKHWGPTVQERRASEEEGRRLGGA